MPITMIFRTGIFMPYNEEYEEYLYLTIERIESNTEMAATDHINHCCNTFGVLQVNTASYHFILVYILAEIDPECMSC